MSCQSAKYSENFQRDVIGCSAMNIIILVAAVSHIQVVLINPKLWEEVSSSASN